MFWRGAVRTRKQRFVQFLKGVAACTRGNGIPIQRPRHHPAQTWVARRIRQRIAARLGAFAFQMVHCGLDSGGLCVPSPGGAGAGRKTDQHLVGGQASKKSPSGVETLDQGLCHGNDEVGSALFACGPIQPQHGTAIVQLDMNGVQRVTQGVNDGQVASPNAAESGLPPPWT